MPKRSLIVAIGLFLATLLIYFPVYSFGFVNFDDPDYVTNNQHVQKGLTMDSMVWAATSTEAANWFPATRLSHLLDVQIFDLHPGGHYFTNAFRHALATVFHFAFLFAATGATWPSAFVAMLFAVHPLHVESVAWIAERKDVLSALFWFLALWGLRPPALLADIAGFLPRTHGQAHRRDASVCAVVTRHVAVTPAVPLSHEIEDSIAGTVGSQRRRGVPGPKKGWRDPQGYTNPTWLTSGEHRSFVHYLHR